MSLANNNELLVQMLIADLLRDPRSSSAEIIVNTFPLIAAAVRARDANQLRRLVTIQHIAKFNYLPPDELIEQFGIEGRIPLSFFITASITNTGGTYAHVGNLVLVSESATNPADRWYFGAYMLMNMPIAIDPAFKGPDMQRFAGLFSGLSIGPGSTTKVDVQFIAHHTSAGKQLSTAGMPPGRYRMTLVGYTADVSRPPSIVFKSAPFEYPFDTGAYRLVFTGGEWMYVIGLEEQVLHAFDLDQRTKIRHPWRSILGGPRVALLRLKSGIRRRA
jgi:hypothetical protein